MSLLGLNERLPSYPVEILTVVVAVNAGVICRL